MYCSVYGCNSNSKNNQDKSLHFFSFPNANKGQNEKRRKKTWIEFCKRKQFNPTKNSTICSNHCAEDAYVPSNSPQLLNSINFSCKRKAKLKDDALPTINITDTEQKSNAIKFRPIGALSRKKDIHAIMKEYVEEEVAEEVDTESFETNNADEHVSSVGVLVSSQDSFAILRDMGLPVRNKSTQVNQPCKCNINKKEVKSAATQTFLNSKTLSEHLLGIKTPATSTSASTGTQTSPFVDPDFIEDSHPLPSNNQVPLDDPVDDLVARDELSDPVTMSDPIDVTSIDDRHDKVYDFTKDILDDESEHRDEESQLMLPDDENEEKVILSRKKSHQEQRKFIVFEESLVRCFERCFKCGSNCVITLESTIGTFSRISVTCLNNISHGFLLSTGPLHNRLPVFHLMITAGILSCGLEVAKVLHFFDCLQIKSITRREFSSLQSAYAIPAVFNVWNREKDRLVREVQGTSRVIASDMRVDSPGHCGLFGSGSSLDVEKNVILDTQIIKSTEVKNSNAMELESLKRQLLYLDNANVRVRKLVTDRHNQVSAYMASEKKNIEHAYDVWHVAKGEKKRLLKLVKKKKFRVVKPWIGSIINHMYWVACSSKTEDERQEKWESLANHIVNIHIHKENKIFVKCTHEVVERQWLKQGSAAHKKLSELITRPRLISAVRKLSNYHQTSGLEAKHSLDNVFASKNTYYPYHSLIARLWCSNLHYNENADRQQAKRMYGEMRWSIAYPKAHKGEKAVAKPIKELPTHKYVQNIQFECLKLRRDYPTIKAAVKNAKAVLPKEPDSLVETYLNGKPRERKEDVVSRRHSRFTKPALPEPGDATIMCQCKGKCATKRCLCKGNDHYCGSNCTCKTGQCSNRS